MGAKQSSTWDGIWVIWNEYLFKELKWTFGKMGSISFRFASLKLWNLKTLTRRNEETKKSRNQEAKQPRNEETKKPRNQETKKPRNQETKNPRNQDTKKLGNFLFSMKGIRTTPQHSTPTSAPAPLLGDTNEHRAWGQKLCTDSGAAPLRPPDPHLRGAAPAPPHPQHLLLIKY